MEEVRRAQQDDRGRRNQRPQVATASHDHGNNQERQAAQQDDEHGAKCGPEADIGLDIRNRNQRQPEQERIDRRPSPGGIRLEIRTGRGGQRPVIGVRHRRTLPRGGRESAVQ